MPSFDHEYHEKYKSAMKRKVVGVLGIVGLVYAFAFIPEDMLSRVLGEGSLASVVGRLVVSGSVVSLLAFALFAGDDLYGVGKEGQFARSLLAANAAKERYGCTDAEAAHLWFMYFGTWGNPASAHHLLLKLTYQRTYSARLIRYLRKVLFAFAAVGVATMLLGHLAFGAYSKQDGRALLAVHAAVVVLYLVGFGLISCSNRIGKGASGPTGCWAKLKDVFERSRLCFQHDILDHAADLNAAKARAEEVRESLA